MDETSVTRRVWLGMARLCTLFRVNTGKAWVASGGKPFRDARGNVVLPGGRPVALGFSLVDGTPVAGVGDLTGYSSITVTPEMVGHRIAVFTTLECKPTVRPHHRGSQTHFSTVVKEAGGISGIVNSPDQAKAAYDDFFKRFDGNLL